MKSTKKFTYLAFGFSAILTISNCLPILAATTSNQKPNNHLNASEFPTTETLLAQFSFSRVYGSSSNRRTQGFRRGGCLNANQQVVAILPSEKNQLSNSSSVDLQSIEVEPSQTDQPVNLEMPQESNQIEENNTTENETPNQTVNTEPIWFTASEYPTVYFYLPENWANKGRFVLYKYNDNEEKEVVYSATMNLPGEATEEEPRSAGVVEVNFNDQGENIPPLEAGNNYLWEVEILCNETDHSGNPFVNGWIQRIDENSLNALNQELENVTDSTAQNEIYAEKGLWYNLVSNIYQHYNADDWELVLKEVDSSDILNQQILGTATIIETEKGDILPVIEDTTIQ